MGLGSGFDDLWFLPLLFSFFIVFHAPSSFDMGCTKYMQRVRFGYRRAIPVMVFNIVGVCAGNFQLVLYEIDVRSQEESN